MKITLKKITKKDLSTIQRWRNLDEIRKFNNQFILLNLKTQQKWYDTINNLESDKKMFLVFNEKVPIGICGLINLNIDEKSAEVAIIIGEIKFHGKGIGSIILKKLIDFGIKKYELVRIEARIFDYNDKSINVFEKVGFSFEVKLREALWRNGRWNDILIFSIINQK